MVQTDRLLDEGIWMTGVINRMWSLMEIEFIVARNAAKDSIPARYSEMMMKLKGGDCRPIKRRGTRSGR
jgi:hypothetical protein